MQVRVARLAMSLARKLQRTSVLNTGSLVGEILDLTPWEPRWNCHSWPCARVVFIWKNTTTARRQDHSSMLDLLSIYYVDGSWSSPCQVQCKKIWLYISSRSNLKNRRMALLSILQRTFFALIKLCAWVFWKTSRHWDMTSRIFPLRLGRWEVCIQWIFKEYIHSFFGYLENICRTKQPFIFQTYPISVHYRRWT